jgi:hypothetical protein
VTFRKTKTGEPVTASLHPAAAEAIRTYLDRRGHALEPRRAALPDEIG